MRARNGNTTYTSDTTNSNLDFSYLSEVSGPNGVGYGINYTNLGGRDRAVGTRFDDSFTLSAGMEYIEGGDGIDTVNYSRSTAGVKVDLNVITQRGGHAEGDALVGIENVTGSNTKDTLTGNAQANVLMGMDGNDTMSGGGGNDTLDGGADDDTLDGGSGNDTLLGGFGNDRLIAGSGKNVLDGGKGIDTADYATSTHGVMVSLDEGEGFELRNFTGDLLDLVIHPENAIARDTLARIENLSGSAHDDVLQGSDEGNTILGNGGDDHVYGRGGADIERGGTGNDHLGTMVIDNVPFFGTVYADDAGDDQLFGEAGNDILFGGSGADRMDGGADFDTVDYTWSLSGVVVDLRNGVGGGTADSWSAGDTFVSIESVIGSRFTDLLFGSTNADVIDGGGSADLLVGNSGDDVLIGGAGSDNIDGSDDNDRMTGGADADTFFFRVAPNAAMLSPEAGDGHDIIHDFHVGEDRLVIHGGSMADLDLDQVGANAVITYAGGTSSITLENVNMTDVLNHFQETIILS